METHPLSQRLLQSGLEIFPLSDAYVERPHNDGCLRLSRHLDNHAPNRGIAVLGFEMTDIETYKPMRLDRAIHPLFSTQVNAVRYTSECPMCQSRVKQFKRLISQLCYQRKSRASNEYTPMKRGGFPICVVQSPAQAKSILALATSRYL